MTSAPSIIVRIGGSDGNVKRFNGCVAWTLMKLIEAGEKGQLQSIEEHHGGPYARWHGRYVLRSAIEVLEQLEVA